MPETAIVEIAKSRDKKLGYRFFLLAAYLETGLRLSEALQKVPRTVAAATGGHAGGRREGRRYPESHARLPQDVDQSFVQNHQRGELPDLVFGAEPVLRIDLAISHDCDRAEVSGDHASSLGTGACHRSSSFSVAHGTSGECGPIELDGHELARCAGLYLRAARDSVARTGAETVERCDQLPVAVAAETIGARFLGDAGGPVGRRGAGGTGGDAGSAEHRQPGVHPPGRTGGAAVARRCAVDGSGAGVRRDRRVSLASRERGARPRRIHGGTRRAGTRRWMPKPINWSRPPRR